MIVHYSYRSDILWHQVSWTCRTDTSVPLTADTVVLEKCLQPLDTTLLTPLTISGDVYMALVGPYNNFIMTARDVVFFQGFTDRRLDASEDGTLPARFKLGIVRLLMHFWRASILLSFVDRPR